MKKLYCVFCVVLATAACKKSSTPDIVFPAETSEGLNTFGAYIDGVEFIAATTLFGNVRPVNVIYEPGPDGFYPSGFLSIQGIDARYSLDQAGNIVMQKQRVTGPGEYALEHSFSCPSVDSCDLGGYENAKTSTVFFIESGRLTITRLDTLAKIISGRFSFVGMDPQGNRRRVTGGVFDARFLP